MKKPLDMPPQKNNVPLNAQLVEKAEKLVKQQDKRRLAGKNEKAVYMGSQDALKKRVGGLATEHGLVSLTADQLEGLFIAAAAEMKDPSRLEDWDRKGTAARAEREAERAAKAVPVQTFYFGRSKPQSEALEKALRSQGFKAVTGSARYWKLRAKMLPDNVIELARTNDEQLWTYDE